jgi:hypothetical protein
MPPKCWYIPTKINAATTQNTAILTRHEFVPGTVGISSELAKFHFNYEMTEP